MWGDPPPAPPAPLLFCQLCETNLTLKQDVATDDSLSHTPSFPSCSSPAWQTWDESKEVRMHQVPTAVRYKTMPKIHNWKSFADDIKKSHNNWNDNKLCCCQMQILIHPLEKCDHLSACVCVRRMRREDDTELLDTSVLRFISCRCLQASQKQSNAPSHTSVTGKRRS